MIVYGRNPVKEALCGRRAHAVAGVWVTHGAARESWLAGVEIHAAAAEEIERRCGSAAHQGICAEVGSYPYVSAEELLLGQAPLIVALDQIQDPQNLGSICRTAECTGASGVVIPERRAAEVTPAVCKASAGAVEHLRIARVRNIADFLAHARAAECWCYGAAAQDTAHAGVLPGRATRQGRRVGDAAAGGSASRHSTVSYEQPDYRGGVVLVLGSEGRGLRPRVAGACDALISLPLHGRIESLGVSAAAAALLYEILQSRARALDKAP